MLSDPLAVVPRSLERSNFLVEDWLIQPALNIMSRDSVITHLEPKAMQVLVCLAEHPGEVLSKQMLISAVWADAFVSDQVLTNAIWQIRQAFGETSKDSQYIQTIPKSGYRLVGKVVPNWQELQAGYDSAMAEPLIIAPSSPAEAPKQSFRQWRLLASVVTLLLVLITPAALFFGRHNSAKAIPSKRVMIAVLPFENLSGDARQDYIGDGMMEEMILQLGMLHPEQLGVIARASALTYKGSGKRVDQIGRELGVDYILEGSVRQDAHKIRVTANLIEVASQRQVWGRNYEQDRQDILLMQSDIARSVAQQIHLQVGTAAESNYSGTNNPEARDEHLQGLFFSGKFTPDDLQKGLEHFQRASQLDPSYAAPHVAMAETYFILGQPLRFSARIPPRDYLAKSKAEALRAIALNQNSGSAHTLLAIALFFNDWDWKGAETEFRRALAMEPNSATTQIYYALFLTLAGRSVEARPHIELALELDPMQLAVGTLAAELYFHGRDYNRAYAQIEKVLEQDPHFDYAQAVLSGILIQMGREKEAVAIFEKRLNGQGVPPVVTAKLHEAFVQGGMPAVYRFFLKDQRSGPGHNFHQAVFYSRLNNIGQGLSYLEKAYLDHDSSLLFIRVHPAFDSLRNDTRFKQLQNRVVAQG